MPSKLFVGNLSFNVADAELNELVAGLSIPVTSVKVMRDADTGRSRGFGFVELAPGADMEAAIKLLNGKVLDGRALTANEARPQRSRGFGGGGGGGFHRGGKGGRRGSNDRDRPPRRRGPELY
jgi:RNA recognition motif-containing protein